MSSLASAGVPSGTSAATTGVSLPLTRRSRIGCRTRYWSPHCRRALSAVKRSEPFGVSRYSKRAGRSLYGVRSKIPWSTSRLNAVVQHVRCDPETLLELAESRDPQKRVANDQPGPTVADDLERSCDRAQLLSYVVALEHRPQRTGAGLHEASHPCRVGCFKQVTPRRRPSCPPTGTSPTPSS